jgi:hypothetical protein
MKEAASSNSKIYMSWRLILKGLFRAVDRLNPR